MESIAYEQERSRRRFPNRVSYSIDYSESIRFQSFSVCHRSTINNFNRSEHDQNIDTASRQSFQREALKTRLTVLNEKSQPSVAMVIHTCHESEHPLAFGRRGQHGERRGNRTLTTRSGHRSSRGLKKGTKRYLILAADRNLRVILRALFRFATARSLQRSMAAFSALFCLRGGP